MSTCEAFASAPGKLILFGEHSVVYGYTAVAAALSDMRISVHAMMTQSGQIKASLIDLPSASGGHVELCASVSALRASLGMLAPVDWRVPALPTSEVIACIELALAEAGGARPPEDMTALVPLLFLSHALLPLLSSNDEGTEFSGLQLTVRSCDLPVGAGLGSSAAFSVALSAALLRIALTLHTDAAAELRATSVVDVGAPYGVSNVPSTEAKRLIDGWAYAAECILHGTPSGLDNAVSCSGFAMRLSRKPGASTPSFERVSGLPALRVLVTNTHVPRKTRKMVAGVRELHGRHTETTTKIFEAIAAVAEEFLATAGRAASLNDEDISSIGELVKMNHQLLCALGVSAPALEQVCAITEQDGLPTKLTGAGGGGCAFTVLGGESISDEAAAHAARAKQTLEGCGFQCFETVVGGQGALWHSSLPSSPDASCEAAAARASALPGPVLLLGAAGVLCAATIMLARATRR